VVVECVVPDEGEDRFTALLDVNMLAVSFGRERDLAAYDALFAEAGWRRTAVHATATPYSLLVLRAAGPGPNP
jgi:O-methyltransferase domain